jgi:hypothetical protein
MIHWAWLILAFYMGMVIGVLLAAILASSGQSSPPEQDFDQPPARRNKEEVGREAAMAR